MSPYQAVKAVHVTCVVLSISAFSVRGAWRLAGRSLPTRGWLRWAPHVNDSVLLAAAIALATMSRQYPVSQDWLTAKVVGLLVYIGLGSLALQDGIGSGRRLAAWLAALSVFAYLVSVAASHDPWGLLQPGW